MTRFTAADVPSQSGKCIVVTGANTGIGQALAVALAEGMSPEAAVRFGCATAGLSVQKPGTAPSMPSRAEIEALLASQP